MSLSTKILITVTLFLFILAAVFLIYRQQENNTRINDIQKSIIEQKQLLDNISRSQMQYVSKEDIKHYAEQQKINLDVIFKDLESLNAEIKAINGITIISNKQQETNIPSTSITPRPDLQSVDYIKDPYGYLNNKQNINLNEKFTNIDVPFGVVSFSAWKDKPWDINIAERKYSLTSVLGQDENGKHYSYAKFSIRVDGKVFDIKIDDNKFLEEYPKAKMHWFNPKLNLMVNSGIGISQIPIKGEITPGISFSLMSYGKTKINPALSILQLGTGYGIVNKTLEFSLSPVQYNLGQHLHPIISNTYIGPILQINTKGNITTGVGFTVGF